MVYIVMVYLDTAYILMAYKVMPHIDMACIVIGLCRYGLGSSGLYPKTDVCGSVRPKHFFTTVSTSGSALVPPASEAGSDPTPRAKAQAVTSPGRRPL